MTSSALLTARPEAFAYPTLPDSLPLPVSRCSESLVDNRQKLCQCHNETYRETQMRFYPPRADVLVKAAVNGEVPCPLNAVVHVGSEDWQRGPEGVLSLGKAVGLPVSVVEGQGHMLSVDYVGGLLDDHLRRQ